MVVSNANVFMAAVSLIPGGLLFVAVANALFNGLAMKWLQLCFSCVSVVFRGERVELSRNLGDDVWSASGCGSR